MRKEIAARMYYCRVWWTQSLCRNASSNKPITMSHGSHNLPAAQKYTCQPIARMHGRFSAERAAICWGCPSRHMVAVATPPPQIDSFGGPIAGEYGFPLEKDKNKILSKAAAKARYMLQDEDFKNVVPARPEGLQGPLCYTVAELEVAALHRWGSEKEFRREQLRREIKRRRKDLRQKSSDAIAQRMSFTVAKAVPFFAIESLSRAISQTIPTPLAGVNRKELYSGLPWDPALGSLPADTSVVGTKAVYTAIATNAIMVVSKLAAFVATGSASVLSEAVHSIADLGNQCLLVVGISQSLKEPDAAHPYGYATERYVWSLISGVGVFFLGCGVSIYHGFSGMMHPHVIEHYMVGMAVLGSAFVFEGYSMWVAFQECIREAKRADQKVWDYIVHGSDAMNVAVLMEDGVAVLGCAIGAGCLYLTQVTGNPLWDSLGSIAIGGLLGCAAMVLIRKNRELLVGRTIPAKRLSHVVQLLEEDPVVYSIHDVKAIMIGADRGRFKAEINFNGDELARLCMKRLEKKIQRFEGLMKGEVEEELTLYSKEFLATLGDEVDRLEGIIRKELPEIRHVDLEIL